MVEEEYNNNIRPVSIPHDIISDILTRLPVKSLTRFRSVSTQWNCTITHPSFSKSHFIRSTGADVTLILTFINRFNSKRTIFSVTIPPNQTRSGNPTHILTIPGFAHPFVSQSLNGLICFNLGSMCVCNPSTRKYIKLPWTEMENANPNCSRPLTCHRSNAFGFDPVTNKHKVLDTWISCHDNDDNQIVMEQRVFTIGSGCNTWRRIANGPSYFPFNECVCINGHVYFRAFPSMIASEKPLVVAFDVNREVFRFIRMCDDEISNSEETVLIEYDGRLTIVDHQGVASGENNVILMRVLLDERNETWVKKRFEIPATCSEINDRRKFMFSGMTFSGEMIFTERSLVSPFCVLLYDIKKNEVKKVEICGLTDFEFSNGNVLMDVTSVNEHVESIVSLT